MAGKHSLHCRGQEKKVRERESSLICFLRCVLFGSLIGLRFVLFGSLICFLCFVLLFDSFLALCFVFAFCFDWDVFCLARSLIVPCVLFVFRVCSVLLRF